jgi:hypothetical protein
MTVGLPFISAKTLQSRRYNRLEYWVDRWVVHRSIDFRPKAAGSSRNLNDNEPPRFHVHYYEHTDKPKEQPRRIEENVEDIVEQWSTKPNCIAVLFYGAFYIPVLDDGSLPQGYRWPETTPFDNLRNIERSKFMWDWLFLIFGAILLSLRFPARYAFPLPCICVAISMWDVWKNDPAQRFPQEQIRLYDTICGQTYARLVHAYGCALAIGENIPSSRNSN